MAIVTKRDCTPLADVDDRDEPGPVLAYDVRELLEGTGGPERQESDPAGPDWSPDSEYGHGDGPEFRNVMGNGIHDAR